MPKGSLTVVGTGIAAVRHATHEARFHIAHADKVFFLLVDPLSREWILRLNPAAESLSVHLVAGRERAISFDEMVEKIAQAVYQGLRVVAVFYGHPGVFVQPSHMAVQRLRTEGYATTMLPGISTEDCLLSDLGVDLSQTGYQCYEASNFLLGNKRPDTAAGLILWQIGVIGQVRVGVTRSDGLEVLTERLLKFYPADHHVTIYEAASLPICDTVMRKAPLSELSRCAVSPVSTLFIPPSSEASVDSAMLKRLDMDIG